jgi:hypothetical protein
MDRTALLTTGPDWGFDGSTDAKWKPSTRVRREQVGVAGEFVTHGQPQGQASSERFSAILCVAEAQSSRSSP